MLAVGEHDAGQCDAALVLHGVADDREGLFAGLAIWHDVVGTLVVALVDLVLGHELVDLDHVRVLELDGVNLLGLDLHVLALGYFVAAALVVRVHRAAGFLIDHLLAQPVAGLAVDLMEPGLLRPLEAGKARRDR
jgi:hypothetical protein